MVFVFILPEQEAIERARGGSRSGSETYIEDFVVLPGRGSEVWGHWDEEHRVEGTARAPIFDVSTPTIAEGQHEVVVRVDVSRIEYADPDETTDPEYRSKHRDCRICWSRGVDSPA